MRGRVVYVEGMVPSPLARSELGAAAVLAVGEAAAWLPMAHADAEAWLRAVGVVRRIGLGRSQVEVVVWGDVVEAIRAGGEVRMPLTTWRAVAQAVGVSEDTLARKRAAAGDGSQPWFEDGEAARRWYFGLLAPKPAAKKRKRAAAAAVPGGAVDWSAVARGA